MTQFVGNWRLYKHCKVSRIRWPQGSRPPLLLHVMIWPSVPMLSKSIRPTRGSKHDVAQLSSASHFSHHMGGGCGCTGDDRVHIKRRTSRECNQTTHKQPNTNSSVLGAVVKKNSSHEPWWICGNVTNLAACWWRKHYWTSQMSSTVLSARKAVWFGAIFTQQPVPRHGGLVLTHA